MTLTGTGYETYCNSETKNKIRKINVSACAVKGNTVIITVTVGGNSVDASLEIEGSDATAVKTAHFTSDEDLSGDIVITYSLTTAGALYVNTIEINPLN